MATQTAQDTYIWYKAESTFGTLAVGSYLAVNEVTSVSGRGSSRDFADLRSFGTRQRVGRNAGRIDEENLVIEVNLTEAMYDAFVATFSEADNGDTDTYTFIIADNAAPDGTAESHAEAYIGCVQVGCDISMDNEGVVTASFEFARQKSEFAAHVEAFPSQTFVVDTDTTFASHVTAGTSVFSMFTDNDIATAAGFGTAAAITNLHEFNLSMSHASEKKYRFGSTSNSNEYPVGIHLGNYDVSGSFIIDFDDRNLLDEFAVENGTITVTIKDGSGTWGIISIDNCNFENAAASAGANELFTIDISFVADKCTFA